jgi:predicted O-methyltransferase YrrM
MLTFEARSGEQQKGLYDFCCECKNILGDEKLNIVEIGSYCGSGTMILSDIFKNSQIMCVDKWEKYVESCSTYDIDRQGLELKEAEEIFDQRISKYPNIIKNKMWSSEFVTTIEDESIDLVYIDGNHDYSFVKKDITYWFPKIKPGAIIGGHDYGWDTVRSAIADTIGEEPYKIFIDGSWFFIKE